VIAEGHYGAKSAADHLDFACKTPEIIAMQIIGRRSERACVAELLKRVTSSICRGRHPFARLAGVTSL